jgi:hypothetical protein
MSVQEVKELFFKATNSKVVIGHGYDQFLEDQLRAANKLGQDLNDKIWPYIPAYRLAHLLFRKAETQQDFFEIVDLLEHAEKSGSNYITLNAGLLKFAALNRLKLLGNEVSENRQRACVELVIEKISAVNEEERKLYALDKPVQSDYFNILEYMVYATAFDYQPLIGAGHDDRNTLFPRFNNDVWTIVGTTGPVDEFSYNYETGLIELYRYCDEDNVSEYFVLGDPHETRILNPEGQSKTTFREIKLLYKIMESASYGTPAGGLADIWDGSTNPHEAAKKGRKSVEEFLGGSVFSFSSATNRWSISKDYQIYGLVKRQHRA